MARPIRTLARGDQAVFEDKPSISLLTPQRIHYFLLGHARAMTFDHRKHAVDHEVCREPQLQQLIRRLTSAQPLQH